MDRNSSSTKVFDFSTQASIMSILAGVRKSELPNSIKNELRDLIFLYTSGGGDESTRIALEQKLTTHGIEPATFSKPNESVVTVKIQEVRPMLEFGAFRPVPSFSAPSTAVKTDTPRPSISVDTAKLAVKQFKSQTTKTVDESIPAEPSQFTPTHVSVTDPAIAKILDATTQESEKNNEIQIPNNEVTESISKAKSVEKSEIVDGAKEQSTNSIQNESSATSNKYLDRIREIKNIVNSKVGNPVNLVDIDNQIGREYMNALLDAMKKLSNAPAAELDSAMQRLESAFVAVDKVVTERSVSADVVKTESVKPEIIKEEVVAKNTEATTPVDKPVPVKLQVETEKVVSKPKEKSGFEITTNTANEIKTPTTPVKSIPSLRVMGEQTPVVAPAVPVKITSLAEEKKVPSFADLPTSLPRNKSEVGNPLYTAEIDAGLDELLSDWSLFKKSGLFGTGPKGKEHPLFKKIAGIQVPLLLAGRFEDATQEIQQSITDYMNGWRYEQGIVYEPGETFEVYLRRVIKHIIDLQKKHNSA